MKFYFFSRLTGSGSSSILSLIYHDNHLNDHIKETNRLKSSRTTDSISSNASTPTLAPSHSNNRFQQNLNSNTICSNLYLSDFLNPILGYSELSISSLTSNSSSSSSSSSSLPKNPNLEAHFTYTIGSSFYNGTSNYAIVLSNSETKELCQIVKKLFVRNVIAQLNRFLNDFLQQQQQQVIQKFLIKY